ncbi:50S ribosomal protein L24 [bacterium]|nr:MAG: 50S ribosomal protein L24 [bacterium]
MKIRKGDKVRIISGKDKGKEGIVAAVSPKEQKILLVQQSEENPEQYIPLNASVKHQKAKQQGERSSRFLKPMPIHISNVQLIDPSTGQPSRVGRRVEDGKLVRYAKKSGETIPTPEAI